MACLGVSGNSSWLGSGRDGGEGLACQAKGSLGFLPSCAGTRHPLSSVVMQRGEGSSHWGSPHGEEGRRLSGPEEAG